MTEQEDNSCPMGKERLSQWEAIQNMGKSKPMPEELREKIAELICSELKISLPIADSILSLLRESGWKNSPQTGE